MRKFCKQCVCVCVCSDLVIQKSQGCMSSLLMNEDILFGIHLECYIQLLAQHSNRLQVK